MSRTSSRSPATPELCPSCPASDSPTHSSADAIDQERKNRLDGEEAILKRLNDEVYRLTDMIAHEQQARKELEAKMMKQMDEKCLALHVELAKEKKLREEAEERIARGYPARDQPA